MVTNLNLMLRKQKQDRVERPRERQGETRRPGETRRDPERPGDGGETERRGWRSDGRETADRGVTRLGGGAPKGKNRASSISKTVISY